MALAARLVPWTIGGLSLVVLGILVVLNPYLHASTATVSAADGAAMRAPPWIVGVALIGVGAAVALVAMFREPTPGRR